MGIPLHEAHPFQRMRPTLRRGVGLLPSGGERGAGQPSREAASSYSFVRPLLRRWRPERQRPADQAEDAFASGWAAGVDPQSPMRGSPHPGEREVSLTTSSPHDSSPHAQRSLGPHTHAPPGR